MVDEAQSHKEGKYLSNVSIHFFSGVQSSPRFNKLQYLQLRNAKCNDKEAWFSLLAAPLKVFFLDHLCGNDRLLERCLATRGCIPTLESFWWEASCYYPNNEDTEDEEEELSDVEESEDETPKENLLLGEVSDNFLHFLKSNKQLTKFMITNVTKKNYQSSMKKIFPILQSFTHLKSFSLSLTYSPDIQDSRSALAAISSLGSLEQLHLGTYWYSWFPNHDAVRKHLIPLKQLRRIAFEVDKYEESPDCIWIDPTDVLG